MRFILMTIVALAAAVGMARAADDVAATVGSTTISKSDLEKHVKDYKARPR